MNNNNNKQTKPGADLKLVVWDVVSRSLVSSEVTSLAAPCTSISWSPSDNALVYSCANGQLSLWLKPVPEALPDAFTIVAPPAAKIVSAAAATNESSESHQPVTGKRKVFLLLFFVFFSFLSFLRYVIVWNHVNICVGPPLCVIG